MKQTGKSLKMDLLHTNELTVDTSTALGQVDMPIGMLSSYMKQSGNISKVNLLHTDKLTVDTSTCWIGTIVCVFLSNWEQYKGGPSAYK